MAIGQPVGHLRRLPPRRRAIGAAVGPQAAGPPGPIGGRLSRPGGPLRSGHARAADARRTRRAAGARWRRRPALRAPPRRGRPRRPRRTRPSTRRAPFWPGPRTSCTRSSGRSSASRTARTSPVSVRFTDRAGTAGGRADGAELRGARRAGLSVPHGAQAFFVSLKISAISSISASSWSATATSLVFFDSPAALVAVQTSSCSSG